MGFLTAWLTNIILLILLATILELMLPNSSMQRYVKMVVGVLLLVVMLQPLLSILTEDIDSWLFSLSNEATKTEQLVTNSINLQKKEIELGQLAYISEQVAVRLESQVEEELLQQHALTIVRIEVEIEDGSEVTLTEPQVKEVVVQVKPFDEKATTKEAGHEAVIQQIEVVKIDTTNPMSNVPEMSNELEEVHQFLSHNWHIPKESIVLAWEGGKRTE